MNIKDKVTIKAKLIITFAILSILTFSMGFISQNEVVLSASGVEIPHGLIIDVLLIHTSN